MTRLFRRRTRPLMFLHSGLLPELYPQASEFLGRRTGQGKMVGGAAMTRPFRRLIRPLMFRVPRTILPLTRLEVDEAGDPPPPMTLRR